jgi:hypothetical protein
MVHILCKRKSISIFFRVEKLFLDFFKISIYFYNFLYIKKNLYYLYGFTFFLVLKIYKESLIRYIFFYFFSFLFFFFLLLCIK